LPVDFSTAKAEFRSTRFSQSPTLARPAAPPAACVQRHQCIKTDKMWLPWQRPLMDRKIYFRLIIYSRSSTDPENLATIGPVDFEIIGLMGITKKVNKKTKAEHSPRACFQRSGRLN